MDFSLSSSLVGSAVLSADKLALDLQFALDKTLTARKGPTPVFTRGSTGRFVGSNGLIQSAAINAPRFDHDPVTGVCKGLLMEESRTNLILQSENLATTWSGLGRTISSDFATSPDGSTTADKIVENTSSGLHGAFQSPTTVSGSTYIGSMYIKAAGRNFAMIYTGAVPANGRYISIPADGTGTVLGLFNANPSTVTLQYVGNGWYRVTISIVSSGVGTSLEIYSAITGTNASYTGDGSSGILVWGAQLELGAFPTSYIPTTTGTLARSADVCSITGSAFSGFYNAAGGTVTTSQILNTTSTTTNPEACRIAGTGGQLQFGTTNGTAEALRFYSVNGANIKNLRTGTRASGVPFKTAVAFGNNDLAACLDGGTVLTDTTSHTIIIGTSMIIGQAPANIQIAYIRYYKKRLPNSKLQTITV